MESAPAPQHGPPIASEGGASERRLVSVLFTDLVGFTSLAEDRDPEAVRDLLTRYFDTATEVIQRHGGTVEKFIGDAVMAVWGTPIAHEDDAERAVRAGLELVDAVAALQRDLQARAGVLSGEAAVSLAATNQGLVAGDLVNTAARLQGVAEPGTVLVGDATRRAAERSIVFEALGDHSLKGKTAPVPAWRAIRVVAQRGGQGRADTLEPPFVGRAEELRELKDVLHAVGREGRTRLVSISGPGGIGKSRLVWELEKYVDGVAEDIYWHRGRSPSYGEGITFWALGEMVRRRASLTEDADEATTRGRIATTLEEYVPVVGERELIGPALLSLLGVEPAPPGGRDVLFPAWRLFFERIAERGTTVLVFEDLQWADTGLLDFIDHLLDWSKALPIMVVTLARPELFDRRPDWAAGRRHLTALALEPLTDAEMAELLAGLLPGVPESALGAVVARAEGVPLYAVETVRSLLADGRLERRGDAYVPVGELSQLAVPDSLRSLIASRLDGLEPSDRSLLQDAAVLGQVFSSDSLSGVSGIALTELEPRLRGLVRGELLELETDPQSPERGQYRFVQSLIREVAYGALGRRDRRARHLAVARHYEGLGDDEMAGALASHYVAAREASDEGPEADAVAVQARLALAAAAERAMSLGAPDQALSFLDQALTLAGDPAERAPLLDRAAKAAVFGARNAEGYGRAAIDAYRLLGDRVAAAAASSRLGKALIETGDVAGATELLEAAVPEAEQAGDAAVLADTLANLSRAYMRVGASQKAVDTADRGLPIAERLNLDAVVGDLLVNKGSALGQLGRRREAVALVALAHELAQEFGEHSMNMRTANNLAAGVADDDPMRATEIMRQAMERARQVGDRGMYIWLVGGLGTGLYDEGREWDAHVTLLRDALETAVLPYDRGRLRISLGLFEFARGENLDDVVADLTDLAQQTTESDLTLAVHMFTADRARIRGDGDLGFARIMEGAKLQVQNPEIAALASVDTAVWARNLEHLRIAHGLVAALPQSGKLAVAFRLHADGTLAAMEGRSGEAIEGLRAARTTMLELGQRFVAARMDINAAILLPGHREVRAWAAESTPLLVELRARPYLERLESALGTAAPIASSSAATTPSVTVGSD